MSVFLQRLNMALIIAESGQPSSQVFTQLDEICKNLGIPVTVIGGMALAAHNYSRFTNDLDILIKQADAYILANYLLQTGWINLGANKLQDSKTKIILNICADSVVVGRNRFPSPNHADPGLNVADLPLLLILKTKANRHKDRGDVVELIKANKLSKQYLIDNVLPQLQPIDQKMLLTLHNAAIKEQKEAVLLNVII